MSGIGDLSQFWRYCLDPLVYLQQKRFKLFGFPAFRHGAYLMEVIQETFDIYVFITKLLMFKPKHIKIRPFVQLF